MNWFANLSLKWKLLVLIVIPIAYLLFLANGEIERNQGIATNNQNLQRLSHYAIIASSLVHELQKERGFTAGFLGSQGVEFATELPEQQSSTDKRRNELRTFLGNFEADLYGSKFKKSLSEANELLAEIDDIRNRTKELDISVDQAIEAYSNTNSEYLNSISYLPKVSLNATLTNMGTAYVAFLQSKERSGIERAVLTGTFAQDAFHVGGYDHFKELLTTQSNYIDVFLSVASESQIDFFSKTMSGRFIEETERMRNLATQKNQVGQFGVDPNHWFEMQTGKINLLKSVEDKLSNDLKQFSTDLSEEAQSSYEQSAMMLIATLMFTAVFVVFIQRRITKPINEAVKYSNRIAEGQLDNTIEFKGTDESGKLLRALNAMQSKLLENQTQMQKQWELERIQAEANNRIRQALNNVSSNVVVADASNKIIFINHAMKSLLSANASNIQKDSSGFQLELIEDADINELIPGFSHTNRSSQLETVRELQVGGLIFEVKSNSVIDEDGNAIGIVEEWINLTEQRRAEVEVEQVIQDAVKGKLGSRLESQRYTGFMENLAYGINNLLDAIIGPLTVAADCMESISKGDIPSLISEEYQGDFNKIKNNLNICISSVNKLVEDANMLENAALNGELAVRADAEKHRGDFRVIINGFNNTLDALISPLNVAAQCMDSIAKGNIPPKITDNYAGDFNKIKNNLNTCIDSINQLIADANTLSDAATNGEFETRADSSVHNGDFQKIIEGVNQTLDSLTRPLLVAATSMDSIAKGDIPDTIQGQYRGGFATFIGNLNTCISAIKAISADANSLAASAQNGNLKARADDSIHQGEFKQIVVSMNGALDAMKVPLDDCIGTMNNLAQGDLSYQMDTEYKGEFKLLSNAVNASLNNLIHLIESTSINCESVENSASEINRGISDLNARTESQASSLEETAASMEEMTVNVKESTINAETADKLASAAQERAMGGGEVVKSAVSSMKEISEASRKIADIIGVIDEIAFQTNLLALNASVEAARAGEQGRGFAVVASEVRNLAQRAAAAAKEIKDLINDSVNKVEIGAKLVNESGETLTEIVNAIVGVSEMMSQISIAAQDQNTGIAEVNKTISQLDDMTQQNAALVEQASAASQHMASQAQEMKAQMSVFRW